MGRGACWATVHRIATKPGAYTKPRGVSEPLLEFVCVCVCVLI